MNEGDKFRQFVKEQYRFEREKEIAHTSVCLAGTLWKIIKDLESSEPSDISEITDHLFKDPDVSSDNVEEWLPLAFRVVAQELFMEVLSGGKCSCGGAQIKSSVSPSARMRRRVHSRIVRTSVGGHENGG